VKYSSTISWVPLICSAALACTAPNPAYRPGLRGEPRGSEQLQDLPDAGSRLLPAEAGPPADSGAPDATAPPDAAPEPSAAADAAPPAPLSHGGGLVARWRLDDTNGKAVRDDSGSNDGALQGGARWIAPGFPRARFDNCGCIGLDGVGAYVELGTKSIPAFHRPKSISAWFWIAAVPGGRKNVLALTNPGAGESLHLGLASGFPAVWTWSALYPFLAGVRTPAPGWHHLLYAYDGGTHQLYFDGVRVGSSTRGLAAVPITRARLGGYDPVDGPAEMLDGRIDDVRVYDRALDETEIAALAAGEL
jgi:concanavalin A-like lectin/glucanase superfamily protein